MNKEKIKEKIENITNLKVMLDVPMSQYTSMKVGGNASMFLRVTNEEDLSKVLKIVKEENVPIYILGNGTNTIVKDGGLDSLIIKIDMKDIKILEEDEKGNIYVEAYSGAQLKTLIYDLAKRNIGPVAELYGVPATVGGAVKMNAGAYLLEMKDLIYETTYMDMSGKLHTISLEEHNFGYRDSFFHNNDVAIIKTVLKLKKVKDRNELKRALEIMQKRIDRQPLDYPNTGSVFKRGENFYASKEIDDAGLKGKQIGGMAVSEKHAGFLINKDKGTCKDFLELVEYVKKAVYENSGNKLELEVIVIGEE